MEKLCLSFFKKKNFSLYRKARALNFFIFIINFAFTIVLKKLLYLKIKKKVYQYKQTHISLSLLWH